MMVYPAPPGALAAR